jgi:flagellar M-ring protein FliF
MDIRRMLLLAGVSVVVLFAVLFFFFRGCVPAARGPNGNTVIYSNLDLRDAANVIARLKELGIPYEIRDKGRAIAVPKKRADEARLGLAEDNLPAGGAVGWEIFDEARLGATDFDRRIQLIRAISGELSRTIRRIEAVEDARVQIVLPETRLFAVQVVPVTASVMLRLRPGGELTPAKVNGIVHLVASSVENLQPANVMVVDNTGRILTAKEVAVAPQEIAPPAEVVIPPEEVISTPEVITEVVTKPALTAEERILLRVRAKKELEANLTGKAQEILNRFYPPNSSIVKVNADIMNSKLEELKKDHDFKIKKITAVILVDKRVSLSKELKQSTFKAVAAAIGYNRKRGDRIVLQKVPFHVATPPPEIIKGEVEKALPPRAAKPILPAEWVQNLIWAGGLLAVLLVLWIIFRIVRRKPGMAEAPLPPLERPLAAERVSAVENIKSMTERNPERIAELLKSWLTE